MRVCPECNTRTTKEHCPVDGRPTVDEERLQIKVQPDLFLGVTVEGKYLIEECLGKGGMAGVYKARHTGTGGNVAIKLMRSDQMADESAIRRFYVEAQNTHRLHHPNTVRVSDFGQTKDGILYLVMEYLPGKPLAKVVEAEGRLSPARSVRIVEQVLKSLGEAHAAGMIHRDVKPENVMLLDQFGEPDFVKVLDFGISRSLGAAGLGTRGAIGTPEFMAPEQWSGKAVDHRADLYSVGCMMYEMLAGRLPFECQTPDTQEVVRCMTAHLNETPPDIGEVAPWVPRPLADLVMSLLCKDPTDRPAGAQDVLQRLGEISRECELPETIAGGPVAPRRVPMRVVSPPARPVEPRTPEPAPAPAPAPDPGERATPSPSATTEDRAAAAAEAATKVHAAMPASTGADGKTRQTPAPIPMDESAREAPTMTFPVMSGERLPGEEEPPEAVVERHERLTSPVPVNRGRLWFLVASMAVAGALIGGALGIAYYFNDGRETDVAAAQEQAQPVSAAQVAAPAGVVGRVVLEPRAAEPASAVERSPVLAGDATEERGSGGDIAPDAPGGDVESDGGAAKDGSHGRVKGGSRPKRVKTGARPVNDGLPRLRLGPTR